METTLARRPSSDRCTSIMTSVQLHPFPPTWSRFFSAVESPARLSMPTIRMFVPRPTPAAAAVWAETACGPTRAPQERAVTQARETVSRRNANTPRLDE